MTSSDADTFQVEVAPCERDVGAGEPPVAVSVDDPGERRALDELAE